jgi:hypothetical protein
MTGVFAGTDMPGQHDVLLGRGKTSNDHSGKNVRMQTIVDLHMDEYGQATAGEKHIIAGSIVHSEGNPKRLGSLIITKSRWLVDRSI